MKFLAFTPSLMILLFVSHCGYLGERLFEKAVEVSPTTGENTSQSSQIQEAPSVDYSKGTFGCIQDFAGEYAVIADSLSDPQQTIQKVKIFRSESAAEYRISFFAGENNLQEFPLGYVKESTERVDTSRAFVVNRISISGNRSTRCQHTHYFAYYPDGRNPREVEEIIYDIFEKDGRLFLTKTVVKQEGRNSKRTKVFDLELQR